MWINAANPNINRETLADYSVLEEVRQHHTQQSSSLVEERLDPCIHTLPSNEYMYHELATNALYCHSEYMYLSFSGAHQHTVAGRM